MFDDLSKKLLSAVGGLANKGLLDASDIDLALADIRIALLEADVALSVADKIISLVREKSLQESVLKAIKPSDQVLKILHDALLDIFGDPIEWSVKGSSSVIMLVGLQGSGKTTTAAKLANWLKVNRDMSALLVSLDVYRPAAWDQLSQLAEKAGLNILPRIDDELPLETCSRAMLAAKTRSIDVVILDTAGRLQIDDSLMQEASSIAEKCRPKEILLVADSLTGQDAVRVASGFSEKLKLSGVILTRLDGDSRGGAALSLREKTGSPIVFQGVGEGVNDFELFNPSQLVSRLLGKGDIISLVEKAQQDSDEKGQERLARRMMEGKFNMNDLRSQLTQLKKMGGVGEMMKLIPGMGKLANKVDQSRFDNKKIDTQIAIISSMTKKERRSPKLLQASRKRRVASGSGATLQDVNRLIKQYEVTAKAMKKFKKTGVRGLAGMMGGGNFPRN